ncbi:MAG: hypothetical protein AAF403_06070 [Pseudomonadota bacterium]
MEQHIRIKKMVAERQRLATRGLYLPQSETSNCGLGFVASIDATPRRDIVLKGIEALKSLWHRGAVDADGKTGDGAGIHIQIPQDFFHDYIVKSGASVHKTQLGVGQIFFSRTDLSNQDRTRQIIESEILNFGYLLKGWRQVPVNTDVLGAKANATRPEIEQILIANNLDHPGKQFETNLYIIRRKIEKKLRESGCGCQV